MLRITEPHELSGWRPQPMDMPLEHVACCPCCACDTLNPVAGIYCTQVVVVSECQQCGWLGYVTRPRSEWFDSFYASDWDEAGQSVEINLSQYAPHPITLFVPQIAKPPASVCDVGCGFGIALYQLREAGFTVYGVEKSAHRRRVANEHAIRTVSDLSLFDKFDVITSHHVLEHTHDPSAFIAEIAEHHDDGGILYLSVPNQVGEPAMGCLLFLPHLHSFTVRSLCQLTRRHGYGLVAHQVEGFNIALAFRKGSDAMAVDVSPPATEKLSRAVHANGQGELLSWAGNLSDAWFTSSDRFDQWRQSQWKPRAVRAERVRGPGRFPVELEVPCLFVK